MRWGVLIIGILIAFFASIIGSSSGTLSRTLSKRWNLPKWGRNLIRILIILIYILAAIFAISFPYLMGLNKEVSIIDKPKSQQNLDILRKSSGKLTRYEEELITYIQYYRTQSSYLKNVSNSINELKTIEQFYERLGEDDKQLLRKNFGLLPTDWRSKFLFPIIINFIIGIIFYLIGELVAKRINNYRIKKTAI
jgi:hypothetical protein